MRRSIVIVGLVFMAVPAAAEPPQCTLPPLESAAPKKVAVKVAAAGWHVHRCANGHEWSHTEAGNFNNLAAHTCPECGSQAFKDRSGQWIPVARNTRIELRDASPAKPAAVPPPKQPVAAETPPPVPFALPTFAGSSCPGGVCPTPQSRGRGWGIFRR